MSASRGANRTPGELGDHA